MELRQLKYFIKAAELSNFTEAANTLYISQSTLSQQIKQLEDELETLLFDRIAKRVYLTEAGRLFLPHAIKTVKESEEGRNLLNDIKNLQTGTLNIGLTYGIADLLLKALLNFTTQYPGIKINIVYGTSEILMEKLNHNDLDFVLSFAPVQQNKMFVSFPLFDSVLSLIVHKDHPMSNEKSINPKQLCGIPLALPISNYSIRGFLDKVLKTKNLELDVRMEVNDINMLLNWVGSCKWATVLMQSSIFNHPLLKAVPISGKEMTRHATITWCAEAYKKKAAVVLEEELTKLSNLLM